MSAAIVAAGVYALLGFILSLIFWALVGLFGLSLIVLGIIAGRPPRRRRWTRRTVRGEGRR